MYFSVGSPARTAVGPIITTLVVIWNFSEKLVQNCLKTRVAFGLQEPFPRSLLKSQGKNSCYCSQNATFNAASVSWEDTACKIFGQRAQTVTRNLGNIPHFLWRCWALRDFWWTGLRYTSWFGAARVKRLNLPNLLSALDLGGNAKHPVLR